MTRLPTLLIALFSGGLAFAEEGEVPMETVGVGGIIGFFVVCIIRVGIFFWYMRPSAKKEPGDKIGEKK